MATNDDQEKTERANGRRQRMDTSWGPLIPAILLVTALFVVFDRHDSNASGRFAAGEPTFSDSAFLGGIGRKYNSSTFRRGEAQAFMGGINLDFREAGMEGSEARLDVTAVMGGVKIRIPRDWTVVNRLTAVMGGVKDRTDSRGGEKRLVIEGTVVMGGIEINN